MSKEEADNKDNQKPFWKQDRTIIGAAVAFVILVLLFVLRASLGSLISAQIVYILLFVLIVAGGWGAMILVKRFY